MLPSFTAATHLATTRQTLYTEFHSYLLTILLYKWRSPCMRR